MLIHQRRVMIPPMMAAITRPHFQLSKVFEIVIRICVGRGSFPPRVVNSFLKMGTITTIITKKMVAIDRDHHDRVDHRPRTLRFSSTWASSWSAVLRSTTSIDPPTSPAWTIET